MRQRVAEVSRSTTAVVEQLQEALQQEQEAHQETRIQVQREQRENQQIQVKVHELSHIVVRKDEEIREMQRKKGRADKCSF